MGCHYSRTIGYAMLVALGSLSGLSEANQAAEPKPVRFTLSGDAVATVAEPRLPAGVALDRNAPGVFVPTTHASHNDCIPRCCQAMECRLEKTTKGHSHPVYGCREKDVCLARCGWVLFGACQECADCEPPRKIRVLLKKIVTEQRPAVECKPVAKNPSL